MTISAPSASALRVARAALLGALLASHAWIAAAAQSLSMAIPGVRAFPESITSTRDGTLYVGRLGDGGVVRVDPKSGKASVFIEPGASGSRSITGVYADEASGTLWACSNDLSFLGGTSKGGDRVSALKAFDLRTGEPRHSIALPGPHSFCNDIVSDSNGAVYVTDSGNPNVLRLPPGGTSFEVFATSPHFLPPNDHSAGLDGIAFGHDGNLYVTTYAVGGLFRLDLQAGHFGAVTRLSGVALNLPDGLRALGKNTFLLVEGTGHLDKVEVEGDGYVVTRIRSGFRAPTSVTRVGSTAWVSEGQLPFFFDSAHQSQPLSLPFLIFAIPLSKGLTK